MKFTEEYDSEHIFTKNPRMPLILIDFQTLNEIVEFWKSPFPVYVPARLFSNGVTRCDLVVLSKNFVKMPQLQSKMEFEALTTVSNVKVLQATSPLPVITLCYCNFIILACKIQVSIDLFDQADFYENLRRLRSRLKACASAHGWWSHVVDDVISCEIFCKTFLQKFANLQNFLLCLISPRWEL